MPRLVKLSLEKSGQCTLPDAEPLRCQLVDRCDEYVSNGDEFRRFVVDLRATQHALALEVFADASGVPLGPLKDWLREPPADTAGASNRNLQRQPTRMVRAIEVAAAALPSDVTPASPRRAISIWCNC